MCPNYLCHGLGFDMLEKMGLYNKRDKFWGWRANFELRNEKSSIPTFLTDTFQNDLACCMNEIDSKFGPFDGLAGHSEGGAILHTLLGMKEAGKLNREQ